MILGCKDIKIEFGVTTVLENVSFTLEDGEKCALVGVNGAGKTTLLRIITGEQLPSGGEITLRRDSRLGYLAQMKDLDPENTVNEELTSVFTELIEAEAKLRQLEAEMAELSGEKLDAAYEKYSRLTHFFELNGGFEFHSRVRGVLAGLGFSTEEGEMCIGILSGGQKTRVSLGKLLLSAPDLLLLDEPTNHLDIESVTWLEDVFLAGYKGSVIVVSHDRYFIDKVATKIIEIENKKSKIYNGSYTFYAENKELQREIEIKHYIEQQKEIKRQEEMIRIYRARATEKMIKRAKSKEKLLAKVERLDRPEALPDKIHFRLEPRIQSGNDVLTVENLSKSFDGFRLFDNVSFEIKRGEIIALIGANGIGKTTMFKMLLGLTSSDGGYIRKGTNVSIGYYDQEHDALDEAKTIFQEIADAYPRLKNVEIRNVLAAFVFYGDDVFKPISALSGGEKGRVALAKIMLGNYNFLLLDEPTNHLDMNSKEILEETLRGYTGTVFYISHDRYFINNTADRIIELERDGVCCYDGGYEYYSEKKAEKKRTEAEKNQNPVTSEAKDEWSQKKERQSETRRRQARLSRIESEIAELESKIAACEESLHHEEVYIDHTLLREIYEEKLAYETRRDGLYAEWEELSAV